MIAPDSSAVLEAPTSPLTPFLAPTGIVVIGASADPAKLGFALTRNILRSDYPGAVHLVNPKGGSILGHRVLTSMAEIDGPADLALILVPAEHVPEAIRQCGAAGIGAAVVASGGFRECGPEGRRLETACLEAARESGVRFIGPNCIGLLDTHVPFDATFLPPPGPPPGHVAFLSHSGAICAAVVDWARAQGFGLSRLMSLGNQADVTETDLLAPVAADPHTRAITLYLESVVTGRRFVEAARAVSRRLPIVALKVGRSEAGRRAAASHTGALAGADVAFDAAFRRAGVLRADTTEELFDQARALAWCPLPKGPGVAILTNAGGPGVTAADALEAAGMRPAHLAPETRAALAAMLPAAAGLGNPVDMLAGATPDLYAAALRLLLADPDVGSALVLVPPPPVTTVGAIVRAIIPVVEASDKPVLSVLMGEGLVQEGVAYLRAAHIPDFRFPERAAHTLAAMWRRAGLLAHLDEPNVLPDDVNADAAAAVLDRAVLQADRFMSQDDVFTLLEAYGIPCERPVPARTPDEAVAVARRLGRPVAMKIAAEAVSHKSDIDGVLLGVDGDDAVADGFRTLLARLASARPDAVAQGVHVQPMAAPGLDVIAGAVADPQFGPLVMFGSGGTDVEGLRDVRFALAPLTAPDADLLLDETWAGRKLRGFRNTPPSDRAAVRDVLFRLARLVADHPGIVEVDINPLRVFTDRRGAVAVDVRMRVAAC